MSENILIGKSRKTGKWELLADPSETYDAHLRIYQKIASKIPVNDDYSRVIFGRVQNTSTPLTLVTTEEKTTRDSSLAASADVAKNAGRDADERTAKIAAQQAERAQESKDAILDEKNALINRIRKSAGLPPLETTKTETAADELAEKLSKAKPIVPKPDAEADAKKTHEELISDKNKLVETVQKTAAETTAGQTKKII